MSVLDLLENYRAQAENLRKKIELARRRKYLSSSDRAAQIREYRTSLDNLEYSIGEMEKGESENVRYRPRSDIRKDGRR